MIENETSIHITPKESSDARLWNDKYASIYQDLRVIQKPYTETFLHLDFTIQDILMDLTIDPLCDEPISLCPIIHPNGYMEISRLPPAEEPLLEVFKPTFLNSLSTLFRRFKNTYICLSVFQFFFLFGMYFQIIPWVINSILMTQFYRHDFSNSISLFLNDFLRSFERFDVFLFLGVLPMPILFTIILITASKHLNLKIQKIIVAIAERLKRKVNLTTRESLNKSLVSFSHFVKTHFQTEDEFTESGINQIKINLHKWMDQMNSTLFTLQNPSSGCLHPFYAGSSFQQTLMQESDAIWKPVYVLCFIIPSALYLISSYCFLGYLLGSSDNLNWFYEPQSLASMIKHPVEGFQNKGFQILVMVICVQIISEIWICAILNDDFVIWILSTSGLFNKISNRGIFFINQWIKRIWDFGVLQPVLPFIKSKKEIII